MIVWGGRDAGGVLGDGGAYDPGGDTWTPLSSDRAPSAREGHTAVWTGTRMIVWGGQDGSGRPLGDGASYDPISDRWSAVSLDGAPTARSGHVATWQDDRMIVWGGSGGEGVTDTGKSYR
jgi:N-acetylneuraminic acid mutarotase